MSNIKKCSLVELKEIWEKFGWLIFKKFEDYVVEVRKVEADIQNDKIVLERLKEENDEKIHQVQLRFYQQEKIVLN